MDLWVEDCAVGTGEMKCQRYSLYMLLYIPHPESCLAAVHWALCHTQLPLHLNIVLGYIWSVGVQAKQVKG